jgi:predicted DNA-binding protein YlxM (UPF0122 family)
MKENEFLDQYCREWVIWSSTRRFYGQPPSKSVLARMQASKTGKEPNARNHPDMPYFNMAVHTLADMAQHKARHLAFSAHYLGEDEVVKRVADRLGISRQTYYEHVKRFAKDAYSMSQSLKRAASKFSTLSDADQAAIHPDDID